MALGWLLIVLAPVVGVVPGPGGVFVFAAGVALLLRHSAWAKRRYVRLKRRWPWLGRHTDRVMRRGKPNPPPTLEPAPGALKKAESIDFANRLP